MTLPDGRTPSPVPTTPGREGLPASSAASATAPELSSGSPRPLIFITIAWALILVTVGTWADYRADHRNDQYQLIALGQCVRDGGRMYIDCWENKPPGVAWLNAIALAVGGGRQLCVWLLPGLIALLALGSLGAALGLCLSATAACVGVMVGAAVFTLRLYDAPSINPDFYSAAWEVIACSVWMLSFAAPRARSLIGWGLLAGLSWAIALSFKQTAVLGLGAITLATLFAPLFSEQPVRRWFAVSGLTWVGAAVGVGGVIALLDRQGNLAEARAAIFDFNRSLLTWDAAVSAGRSWFRAGAGLAPVAILVWLGVVGLVGTLARRGANKLSSPFALAMFVWWVVALAAALIGPSGSMRYFQAAFPPMIFLAGTGVFHLEETLRRLGRGYRAATLVTVAAVVLLLGRPLFDFYREGVASSYQAYKNETARRGEFEEIGRRVRELTPDGGAIYVLAYDAGVYVFSERRPASRFTYPRSAEQMGEILAGLESGKAAVILKPKRTASEFEPWCDSECHGRIETVLASYPTAEPVGSYAVFTRPAGEASGP